MNISNFAGAREECNLKRTLTVGGSHCRSSCFWWKNTATATATAKPQICMKQTRRLNTPDVCSLTLVTYQLLPLANPNGNHCAKDLMIVFIQIASWGTELGTEEQRVRLECKLTTSNSK
jgi:hypothetical protein